MRAARLTGRVAARGWLLLASLVAACEGDASAPDAAPADAAAADAPDDAAPIVVPPVTCEGPRPASLDDCAFVGDGFAECGGSGDPRLACAGYGDCKWFLGGCVPASHEPSPCLVGDACCVDGFPLPLAGDECDWLFIGEEIRARAGAVWDRTREANVEVRVDPTLSAPAEPALTCTGACAPTFYSVCVPDREGSRRSFTTSAATIDDTPGIRVRWVESFSGSYLSVEILPGPDGTLRARAFTVPYTDACPSEPVCPFDGDPREAPTSLLVARGGSIVVDDAVSPQHATLQLTMSDCFTIDAAF